MRETERRREVVAPCQASPRTPSTERIFVGELLECHRGGVPECARSCLGHKPTIGRGCLDSRSARTLGSGQMPGTFYSDWRPCQCQASRHILPSPFWRRHRKGSWEDPQVFGHECQPANSEHREVHWLTFSSSSERAKFRASRKGRQLELRRRVGGSLTLRAPGYLLGSRWEVNRFPVPSQCPQLSQPSPL